MFFQENTDIGQRICASRVDQPPQTCQATAVDPQVRMTNERQPIPHHRLGVNAGQTWADRDVGKAFFDQRRHLFGRGDTEADLEATGTGSEGLQQRRHDRLGERAGGDDPQQLGRAIGLPDRGLGIDREVDHLGCDRHDPASGRGQFHACATSRDQRVVEVLAQRGEGLGHRRFADTQCCRRGAYRPESRDQDEDFQLGERHRCGTVGRCRGSPGVEITLRLVQR